MYAVESSLNTETPVMLINQQIGCDPGDPMQPYIDGALFQRELLELDNGGYKSIRININCLGGSVIEGFSIINAILHTKTPVDTYNTGVCASMGAFIWITGRKRVMADYSCLMIHNPFGDADKKMIESLRQSCITLFASKCNMTNEEVEKLMDKETWFLPAECFAKGMCTEIEVTSQANQKRMPLITAKAVWKEANKIQANILNIPTMEPNKQLDTSLIAAYLDLNADSSPSAVMTALKSRINAEVLAKGKAEDDMEAMKKKLDAMKADYDALKAEYSEMKKAKADAEALAKKDKEDADAKAKKDKEDLEAKAKKIEAKAVVEVYAKVEKGSRIKAEKVDEWVETALVLGVDKVKAMLEDLPLNVKASGSAQAAAKTKTDTGDDLNDPEKIGMSAMHLQARVQANARDRFKKAS